MSAVSTAGEATRPRSSGLAWLRATGPVGIASVVVMAVATFVAVFGPLLAPYPPNLPDLSLAWVGPTGGHLLGYDFAGRDVLSRLLAGMKPPDQPAAAERRELAGTTGGPGPERRGR